MITAEQVHGWSDYQLRVAIAEALGWKKVVLGQVYAYTPTGSMNDVRGSLPDWPADLNAAAELEFDNCILYIRKYPQYSDLSRNIFVDVHPNAWSITSISVFATTESRARSEAWYLWHLSKGNQS